MITFHSSEHTHDHVITFHLEGTENDHGITFSVLQLKSCVKGKNKKKDADSEEEDEMDIVGANIPETFLAFVKKAVEERKVRLEIEKGAAVYVETGLNNYTTAGGFVVKWGVKIGDVRGLHLLIPTKDYTLAVADIPYGYKFNGAENDEEPFSEEDCEYMMNSFLDCNTSPIWRFVIFHSTTQSEMVHRVLKKFCNAGVEIGIW